MFRVGRREELGRVFVSGVFVSDGVYIVACIVAIGIGTLILFWNSF